MDGIPRDPVGETGTIDPAQLGDQRALQPRPYRSVVVRGILWVVGLVLVIRMKIGVVL